jgi:1-phosphatidylinositol-4-phosphate 5-kinase
MLCQAFSTNSVASALPTPGAMGALRFGLRSFELSPHELGGLPRSHSEDLLTPTPRAPAHEAPKSQAQHYEVDRFRNLRSAFGISATAYARSFPDDLSELGSNWQQRLKESVSEGKSGSFFYRVSDGKGSKYVVKQIAVLCYAMLCYALLCYARYIVKQISRAEKRALMAILPAYEEHVTRRGGRSLIHYYGCHSMKLRWVGAGAVYFVVMRNFLPVRPWLAFDLKGATANRRALAAKLLHEMNAGAIANGGVAYGTLRDWEWLDIAMSVDVSDADKAELAEMVRADADFMCAQGLLDYSLLVGIYRVPASLAAEAKQARLDSLVAQGGYISLDRQKVYFFGIIDVLERWNLRWKLQRAVLTTGYHSFLRGPAADGISALHPSDYADRFHTFAM